MRLCRRKPLYSLASKAARYGHARGCQAGSSIRCCILCTRGVCESPDGQAATSSGVRSHPRLQGSGCHEPGGEPSGPGVLAKIRGSAAEDALRARWRSILTEPLVSEPQPLRPARRNYAFATPKPTTLIRDLALASAIVSACAAPSKATPMRRAARTKDQFAASPKSDFRYALLSY